MNFLIDHNLEGYAVQLLGTLAKKPGFVIVDIGETGFLGLVNQCSSCD